MESSKETGCQAPEGPILCINNCGFFGSPATMNMCSKCHKDMVMKQQQTKLAATSIENIVNGSSTISNQKEPVLSDAFDTKINSPEQAPVLVPGHGLETTAKTGPNRCTTCCKRVGLTGFNCKCGNLFCSVHRYSDKHDCPFDYRTAAQDAIAKANPLVKADKLNKI